MTALEQHTGAAVLAYIIDATKEIDNLQTEITELGTSGILLYDIEAYRKYKRLIGARDVLKEQIRDCEKALRE